VYSYNASGLSVGSEIELSGFDASVTTGLPPDVTIRWRSVPKTLDCATSKGLTWDIGEGKFLLRVWRTRCIHFTAIEALTPK
jgi:hypothetical protein